MHLTRFMLIAAVVLGSTAAPASALEVGRWNDGTGYYVHYDAEDETETNNVTVSYEAKGAGAADDVIRFVDSAATFDGIFGEGCKVVSAHTGECSATGVYQVIASLDA